MNEESSPQAETAAEEESNQISFSDRASNFLRMGLSVLLFIGVWILSIIVLPNVPRNLLTTVLKAAVILIAGFLPAIIFGYFQSRRQILLIEYKQNLRRLGFAENAQIYRRKFDAIYGNSDMSNRREIVFQTPIIVATLLSFIGWVVVFYPPVQDAASLSPNATTLAYGFLGAYVFAIGSLVRQYVTDDLQQRYYASIVYRYLAVFVLAGLLTFLFPGEPSGAILAAAFTIGFFPSMGIRIIVRIGTNLLNSISRVQVEGFEDEHPLHLLQGPNAYHEDRLLLEGIENIQNLACADIVDLMLKTRFPVEQLVDWIDQSLLYLHTGLKYLPFFRQKGVRSATDFIDVFDQLKPAEIENRSLAGLLDEGSPLTAGQINAIAVSLRNDPNMFHVRYWRDHQFELLSEDVVLSKEANLKLMQGFPDEAIELYDQLLQRFPNYHLGHFYRGLAHAAARKFNRASDDFRTALALASPDWENAPLARLQLGKALEELGEFEEALEAYQQAYDQKADFAEAHLAYALLQMRRKDFTKAITHLKLTIENNFRTGEAYASLGKAELEQWNQAGSPEEEKVEKLTEIANHYERSIRQKPSLLNAYLDLALVLEEIGNVEKARDTYTELIARPESEDDQTASYLARLRRGNLYFEAEQYQLAIVDYQDAVDMSPDESGYYNLGLAYLRTGQTEPALDAFRQTTRLNNKHLPAYQRLGELALDLNYLIDAADAFRRILQIQKEEGNLAGQMVAHLNLGRAFRRMGNRNQEAQRQLNEAADLAGKLADDLVFTSASFELGLLNYEEKQMEKAAEHFATAAELFDVLGEPQRSVESGLYLTRTLNAQGKTAEAVQALDDAESRLNTVFDQTQPEDVRLQNEIIALRPTLIISP